MKTKQESLRKIVKFLNNPNDDGGGFWLPNIQRNFVWSEDQICRLYDSIMREYPISSLLVWRTKSTIRRRKFVDNFDSNNRSSLQHLYIPEDDCKKILVLDGQQRLQSLYIGLCGSYNGKELYLDILSGEQTAPDDISYKFSFIEKKAAFFPNVLFKSIVNSDEESLTLAESIIEENSVIDEAQKKKISKHISRIFSVFHSEDKLPYIEIDSIDKKGKYSEDDVVEIFIRANAGGTKLNKSDLLFSLLTASWDVADKEMEIFLTDINRYGFNFSRDFVLKTCLALLDMGARYEIVKFRNERVRPEIEKNWDRIKKVISVMHDYLRNRTFIQCDKGMPSYLVLIPILYAIYHFETDINSEAGLSDFIVRSLLTQAFSGSPDQLIDSCVTNIKKNKGFDLSQIENTIKSNGRSLSLTNTQLWDIKYGSNTIHLLLNLWYKKFTYTPIYSENMPQVDHIFPQSLLKKVKKQNPTTGRNDLLRYQEPERNQLANCMLLTKEENGAGQKWDTSPEDWFKDKDDAYLDMHLIPHDRTLWKLENYDKFIEARKELILKKFDYLISN